MDFSNNQKLKFKIEELQKETGLSEEKIKQIFVKEYLINNDDEDIDKMFGEMLRGK
jgi:beta-N-acetylglucosaminidase